MTVGADQRVGIGNGAAVRAGRTPDGLRQEFQIYLMANAGARRHDAKIVERLLAPTEERVTFAVAVHFDPAAVYTYVIVVPLGPVTLMGSDPSPKLMLNVKLAA